MDWTKHFNRNLTDARSKRRLNNNLRALTDPIELNRHHTNPWTEMTHTKHKQQFSIWRTGFALLFAFASGIAGAADPARSDRAHYRLDIVVLAKT